MKRNEYEEALESICWLLDCSGQKEADRVATQWSRLGSAAVGPGGHVMAGGRHLTRAEMIEFAAWLEDRRARFPGMAALWPEFHQARIPYVLDGWTDVTEDADSCPSLSTPCGLYVHFNQPDRADWDGPALAYTVARKDYSWSWDTDSWDDVILAVEAYERGQAELVERLGPQIQALCDHLLAAIEYGRQATLQGDQIPAHFAEAERVVHKLRSGGVE